MQQSDTRKRRTRTRVMNPRACPNQTAFSETGVFPSLLSVRALGLSTRAWAKPTADRRHSSLVLTHHKPTQHSQETVGRIEALPSSLRNGCALLAVIPGPSLSLCLAKHALAEHRRSSPHASFESYGGNGCVPFLRRTTSVQGSRNQVTSAMGIEGNSRNENNSNLREC